MATCYNVAGIDIPFLLTLCNSIKTPNQWDKMFIEDKLKWLSLRNDQKSKLEFHNINKSETMEQ